MIAILWNIKISLSNIIHRILSYFKNDLLFHTFANLYKRLKLLARFAEDVKPEESQLCRWG